MELSTIKQDQETCGKHKEMKGWFEEGRKFQLIYSYSDAIECVQKGIDLAKELQDGHHEELGHNTLQHLELRMKSLEEIERNHTLGTAYQEKQQYVKAIETFQRSIELAKQVGNIQQQMKGYTFLCTIYQETGQKEKCFECFQKATELNKDMLDLIESESPHHSTLGILHQNVIESYLQLGNKYHISQEYEKAVNCIKISIYSAKKIGAKQREMIAHGNLGRVYKDLHQYEEAVDNFKKSIELAKEIGDKQNEMFMYNFLGISYQEMENYDDAIDCYENYHLHLAQELGDVEGEILTYHTMAVIQGKLNKYSSGIAYQRKVLDTAVQHGNKASEMAAHFFIGSYYNNMSKFNEAVYHFKKSIDLAKELGNKDREITSSIIISSVYLSMGQDAEALNCAKRSYHLIKESGDQEHEPYAFDGLINIYKKRYPQESLIKCIHKLCNDLAEEFHPKQQEMQLHTYWFFGHKYIDEDNETALECFKSSIHVANELGDKKEIMKHLRALISTYEKLQQNDNAIDSARTLINMAHELGDKEEELIGYGFLVDKLQEMDCSEGDTVDCCAKCIELAKEVGDKEKEMVAYKIQGCLYLEMCQYDNAIECYKNYLELAKKLADVKEELNAQVYLSKVYLHMENLSEATKVISMEDLMAKIDLLAKENEDEPLLRGIQSLNAGKCDEAEVLLKKSIEESKLTHNLEKECSAYRGLQILYQALERWEDEITCWHHVIDLSRELGDKIFAMQNVLLLSDRCVDVKKFEKAISTLQGNVNLANEKTWQMKCFYKLGEVYKIMCEEDVHLNMELKYDAISCTNVPGQTSTTQNRKLSDESIDYSLKCLEIAKEIGDKHYELMALLTLTDMYDYTNQLGAAYTVANEGVQIADEVNDIQMGERFQCRLEKLQMSTDDKPVKLKKISEQNSSKINPFGGIFKLPEMKSNMLQHVEEVQDLIEMLTFYQSSQEYHKCIEVLQKLKESSTNINEKVKYSCNIINYYCLMKQDEKALHYCEVILPEVKKCTNDEILFEFYFDLANLYFQVGLKFELATKYFREAIKCFNSTYRSLGEHEFLKLSMADKTKYVRCFDMYSNLLTLTFQYEEAISVLDQCRGRVLREILMESYGMTAASKNITLQYSNLEPLLSTGNFSLLFYWAPLKTSVWTFFVNKLKEKLPIASEVSSKVEKMVNTAFDVLQVRQVTNCEDRSIERYFSDGDDSASCKNKVVTNPELVNVSTERKPHKVSKTEAIMALTEEQSPTNELLITMDTFANLGNLLQKISKTINPSHHPSDTNSSNDSISMQDLGNLEENLRVYKDLLAKGAARFNLASPEDINDATDLLVKGLRCQLANHEDTTISSNNTNVLGCCTGAQHFENPDAKDVFLKTTNKPIHDEKIPDRNVDLEYLHPSDIEDEDGSTNIFKSLFKILIPNQGVLNHDEIVIVPDGLLNTVPFAALQDPDTGLYLSETKRIRLVPSIQSLAITKESPENFHHRAGALIIGDPAVGKVMLNGQERSITPLEGARQEAMAIASVLGVPPLIGDAATKEAVVQKLKQGVSVVHIAAHGVLSKATIVLAPSTEVKAEKIPVEEDYMLTMADVQKAKVRAKLVVLGCCHSGRGEIKAEGVVGMCRAFLASGACAVIGSLWAIADEATLVFMKHFYGLLKEGKSAGRSLQETMRYMREETRYHEPKFWAPFFLIGDDVTIQQFQSSEELQNNI